MMAKISFCDLGGRHKGVNLTIILFNMVSVPIL